MMKINLIILVLVWSCSFAGAATEVKLSPITYNEKSSSFIVSEAIENIAAGQSLEITNLKPRGETLISSLTLQK